jgi:hypothetical protein
MRACEKCRGRGKVSEDPDDYFDFNFGAYHQSRPVHQVVCAECRGRGLIQSQTSKRPKTRAETELFRPETDDWTLEDWEWDEHFAEFAERFRRFVDVRGQDAVKPSIIDKALALKRMTVTNGTTVAEAATALRLLTNLLTKYGLTKADLDEYEARRA